MSKWTNLLLDVNYMKQYAAGAARVVTIDISRFGETDEQRIKDAAEARYQLDQLLLDESSLAEKWSQVMIHDFESARIVFRGNHKECVEWMKENDTRGTHEIYYALPDDQNFSWTWYFNELKKRCGIEIEFLW